MCQRRGTAGGAPSAREVGGRGVRGAAGGGSGGRGDTKWRCPLKPLSLQPPLPPSPPPGRPVPRRVVVATGRPRGGGLRPGLGGTAAGLRAAFPSRWHRGPGAGGEPLRAALRRRGRGRAAGAGGKAAALGGIAPAGHPPLSPQTLGREVTGEPTCPGSFDSAAVSPTPAWFWLGFFLLIKETDLGPATAPSCPHHGVHPEEEKQEIPKL